MGIQQLSLLNIDSAIEVLNTPFDIIGRIVPEYTDDKWTFKEELYDNIITKLYKQDIDYDSYLNDNNKVAFIAVSNGVCVGVIFVHRHWNCFCYIDSIHVDINHRGHGIGIKLMDRVSLWAKEKGLAGIMLETQDNNLKACRFYAKYGMEIGGVDKLFYSAFDKIKHEKAVMWYKNFRIK